MSHNMRRLAVLTLPVLVVIATAFLYAAWPRQAPLPTLAQIAPPTVGGTPTPWPIPTGRSECSEASLFSEALGEKLPFYLYLPPGYFDQTARRYPTLYLLSGGGGNYKEWSQYGVCPQMDQLVRSGQVQPMIVVMPSGNDNPAVGTGSYWFNHAPPPVSDGKRWGDYIWQDVVQYIDSQYRTLPDRTSRAIGGLSAGGQAAMTHALTHPEVFSVLGAHSPSLRRADGSMPEFGDPAYYDQYDPIWLVQNTQTWTQLSIWIDDGESDTQWGGPICDFHNLLDSLDIPHEWHLFPGAHEPAYWQANVPNYLQWYSSQLTGAGE